MPLLRNRSFLLLLVADVQSVVGDQIGRVALSILVFRATDSAVATALTYAATFVPAVLGGAFLAGVADLHDRRAVMVGCELVRAALFGVMVIRGMDVAGIVSALIVAVLLGPVFGAARTSYLSEVLPREQFGTSNGIRLTADQAAQVAGFAIGGLVVALLGPFGALGLNCGTFLVSAVLVSFAVAQGPRAVRLRGPARASMRSALSWFGEDRLMLALLALSAADGFFIVPEGLTVPFGQDVGATAAGVGLLFAALPLGSAIGAGGLVRFVAPAARPAVARRMACLCGVPLLASALDPAWPVAFATWTLCGIGSAYQVEVITTIAQRAPDEIRARVIGFGGSVVLGAQGLSLAVFGLLAWATSAGSAMSLAGAAGCACALVLVAGPLRAWTSLTDTMCTAATSHQDE